MQQTPEKVEAMTADYLSEPYVPGPEIVADETLRNPEDFYFCAKDVTFYLPSIHGDTIPDNAVAVSKADHQALIEGMSNGMVLSADKRGLPILQPVLDDLETARRVAHRDVAEWIGAALAGYTAGIPPEELASWPLKAAAAKLHLAGDPQAMIADEAALTGEDPDDLAALIVSMNEPYTRVIASLTGLRRMARQKLDAAKTAGDVAAARAAVLAIAGDLAGALQGGAQPARAKTAKA